MSSRKVVRASAGTGKTYRLALEYISQILLGEDYSEILFMTFTRKATAEIKIRIFEFLEELSNGSEELEGNIRALYPEIVIDKEKISLIKKELLLNKDKVRIFTIDSFVGQIFKKAIGPYLNIYSYGSSNQKEEEETYRNVFSKIIDGQNFEKMRSFLEKTADRDVEKYIDLIRVLSKDRWKFKLIKEKNEGLKDIETLKDQLFRSVIKIFEFANILVEEHGKDINKVYAKVGKEIKGIENKEDLLTIILENEKEFLSNKILHGGQMAGKERAYIKAEVGELQVEIFEKIKEISFVENVLPYEKDILEIEKIVREIYETLKFKEKKFTFSDITNYTSEYLGEEELDLIKDEKVTENFYEIIGGKITTLFLDEAQDTSVSQWRIIEPIAKGCKNVIIVGDGKQSIYSWRGGDKGLFLTFEKILEAEKETLPTNYRSEKKIIDFVNTFFEMVSKSYKEEVEDGIWEYEAVNCSKKTDEGMVGVIVHPEIHEKIAMDIKKRHEKDGVKNYHGVGVIASRKKDLNKIADSLKELDIPFIVENSLSIVHHPCVEEILKIFKYLVTNDYKTLIEIFRTTLKINEKRLKIMLKNRIEIEKFLKNSESEKELEIDGFLEEELIKIRKIRETSYEKIGLKIIQEYNLIDKYRGSRDTKNINFFLELMEGHEELWRFLNFLEANKDSEGLGQVGINEINSVILMTIHKSKGLDFHTEYLFLRDKKSSFKITGFNDGVTTHKLQLFTKMDENYEKIEDYLFTSSIYKTVVENTNLYKHAEKIYLDEVINTWYVAMTRPKANLILCIEPTKTTFKKETIYVLKNDSLISPIEEFFGIGREELLKKEKVENGNFIEYKIKEKKIEEDIEFTIDRKIYQKAIEQKEMTSSDENAEKVEEESETIFTIEKELKRKVGLAIHYYLENIKYATDQEKKDAKKLMLNKYSNMLGVKKIEEALSRIENFINKHQKVFDKRWEIFQELEILYNGKKKIIDRLNVDKKTKEIIIYDYKSGTTMKQGQLDEYKKILEEKLGEKYSIKTEFLKLD